MHELRNNAEVLANRFNRFGYQCIHVISPEACNILGAMVSVIALNDYIQVIHYDSLIDLCELLQKYNIVAVVPGFETGVLIADMIIDMIGLTNGNVSRLSEARRNKFTMINTIADQNLRTAKSLLVSDASRAINWFNENKFRMVVVKPLFSAASDLVFFCSNSLDLQNKVKYILNSKTIFGESNKEVLVQEYIDGEQYIVNSVSLNGKHITVDVWKESYLKKYSLVDDSHADLITHKSEYFMPIVNYIHKCLDALGIKNGCSHSELKLTKNGPVIIEVGARLAGRCDFDVIANIFGGQSQIDLLIQSIVDPIGLLEKVQNSNYLHTDNCARYIYLTHNEAIKLNSEIINSNLPYVYGLHINQKIRDYPTTSYCYLISKNTTDISNKHHKILSIVKNEK